MEIKKYKKKEEAKTGQQLEITYVYVCFCVNSFDRLNELKVKLFHLNSETVEESLM